MSSTSTGGSPFLERWLFFSLFAGTALLAATVVTEGVRATAPPGSGAHGLGFAVVMHGLTGATLGALAAFRLRAGGTQDERVNVDALALGVALAVGAVVAAWLTPLGTTMKTRGALAIWPIAAAGVAGAALAASRGGRVLPLTADMAATAPLTVGEQAAAQQALAAIDTLERTLARVADPAAARPDDAETARFCEADELVGERCGRLPAGHAVTRALREAGHALTSAVELHYVARGWHAALGLEAGDAAGVAAAQRRWALDATDPVALADALADRARVERQAAEASIAAARPRV